MQYAVGFAFDKYKRYVVLIQKARPEWQAGLLNGVGGKIEPGEDPLDAMRREFREETGVTHDDWTPVTRIHFTDNSDKIIYVFKTTLKNIFDVKTTTDETVVTIPVEELPEYPHISNLDWLIPMCWTKFPVTYVALTSGDAK